MRSVMWKELTAEDLRAKAAENAIVILPIASMEQHGPHLPVGVDTFLVEAVCKSGAELAVKDVPVVVAPTLWCGMAEHHMAYGGTFTFDIPTYLAVLRAFLVSIKRHGFRRVVFLEWPPLFPGDQRPARCRTLAQRRHQRGHDPARTFRQPQCHRSLPRPRREIRAGGRQALLRRQFPGRRCRTLGHRWHARRNLAGLRHPARPERQRSARADRRGRKSLFLRG